MQKLLTTLAALCSLSLASLGQSLPVGSPADQYLRFLQLADTNAFISSMANRPMHLDQLKEVKDSLVHRLVRSRFHFQKRKNIYAGVLPLGLNNQLVTHHPFAQNDGAMIGAKGYQAQVTGGVYGRLGPLSIQLSPEWVIAANRPYKRNIDFGTAPNKGFKKLYLGQSYVRLQAGPVALSLASENMWWGPGYHHTLIMSNQAPGFAHIKLHSIRPLKTPIGNFEWTLLGGRLRSNQDLPFENDFMRNTIAIGPAADRYLNAYVLSYLPKFLPGFSLGFSRALQQYEEDVKASGATTFSKYLPVILKPVQKINAQDDDAKRVDQVAAAFFRWQFKKSKAEVYAEYGFNDYKKNVRDFVLNIPHSAAYLVGFKKVFPLPSSSFIEAGVEVIQLRQTTDRMVRDAGIWYVHGSIWEGYTHQNQVMGAAFASNAQTVQLAKRTGLNRTAVTFQRFQRDPDRQTPKWNDWVLGLAHAQFFKGFYFDGQVQMAASRNYTWEKGNNPLQVIANAGVRYYFHD